jgi:hypothetical protein
VTLGAAHGFLVTGWTLACAAGALIGVVVLALLLLGLLDSPGRGTERLPVADDPLGEAPPPPDNPHRAITSQKADAPQRTDFEGCMRILNDKWSPWYELERAGDGFLACQRPDRAVEAYYRMEQLLQAEASTTNQRLTAAKEKLAKAEALRDQLITPPPAPSGEPPIVDGPLPREPVPVPINP